MDKIFQSIEEHFSTEKKHTDSINDTLQAFDESLSFLATKFQSIHSGSFTRENGVVGLHALLKEKSSEIQKSLKILNQQFSEIGAGAYYKFSNLFNRRWADLVALYCLCHFLAKGEGHQLMTKAQIEEELDLSSYPNVELPLDDYLMGVCNFCSEIVRYSRNCVIRGWYEDPVNISEFLNDLYGGLKLLNLKNDNLRKRFDGIKYDMKAIEGVVYDLKIRGLVKEQNN